VKFFATRNGIGISPYAQKTKYSSSQRVGCDLLGSFPLAGVLKLENGKMKKTVLNFPIMEMTVK